MALRTLLCTLTTLLLLGGCGVAPPATTPTGHPAPVATSASAATVLPAGEVPTDTPAPSQALAPQDLSLTGGYSRGYYWDSRDSDVYYPVRMLRQAPDLSDPWQAEDPNYGCGPRMAFQSIDRSWTTGFDYYTGFRGSTNLLSRYGILAMKDAQTWVLLNRLGQETVQITMPQNPALPSPMSVFSDFPMSEGMGLIFYGEKQPLLLINLTTGQTVVVDGLLSVEPYSDGLALAAETGSGLYGYLDKSGQWAMPPQFIRATSFQGGRAVTETVDGDLCVIDPTGKILYLMEKPKVKSSRGEAWLFQSYGDGVHFYELRDWKEPLLRLDGDFEAQPITMNGYEVKVTPEGWYWYDDGADLRLWRGDQRSVLPTGYEVLHVVDERVYLRDLFWTNWGDARAVYTLAGAPVVPFGAETDPDAVLSVTPVTDGVSGAHYIVCLYRDYCSVLSRDGRVLATLPKDGGDSETLPLRIALALDFTPDPQSGALLAHSPDGLYWPQ